MKKLFLYISVLAFGLFMVGCKDDNTATVVEHSPRLLSIIPKAGYPGTEATISGYWFSEDKSNVAVEVGGVAAQVVSSTIDRINIIMPEKELGSYSVKVSVGGKAVEGLHFRYADAVVQDSLKVYMHGTDAAADQVAEDDKIERHGDRRRHQGLHPDP